MIKNLTKLLLLLSITGCTTFAPVVLPVDPAGASSFAERVKLRFANYADTSGYESSGPRSPFLRDGEGEPVIWYHARGSTEEVVVYTFDRSDSCIIFSGTLAEQIYELRIQLLPIPTGRYLLKLGGTTESFDRP
jgi:hypothetical protein